MHKKKTHSARIAATLSVILAVLFGGLFAQSVRAVISNPTPICVGSTCTVTFSATNDYYLWSPPAGARNISFDLMGAQGGRSGGLGGRVTGSLTSVPSAIYIYVGGPGAIGSGVTGGFNGGGTAGNNHNDEGSGGGATDIRTSTTLGDRLAVAGGGGGSGGFGGGAGGAGGNLTANSGINGQGQGGSGGTQSAGGNGGSPNGGTGGSSGSLGIGGQGGTSSTAGGGGGGGGYFGGGGGGADNDACCTNGGGGGGGSSWTHATATSAVVHTSGYRSGTGVAIISYVLPPSVSNFTPRSTTTNAASISYDLVFSESVTGLTSADFTTSDSTARCNSISATGSGNTYVVTATDCSVGVFKLTLSANTITASAAGPSSDRSAEDVLIERTLPTVSITAPTTPTNFLTHDFQIAFSENVSGVEVSDFVIRGSSCSISTLTGSGQSYSLQVSGCQDAAAFSIAIASNSVIDAAQNLGPAVTLASATISVDRSAGQPVWQTISSTNYVSPNYEINFPEPVLNLLARDFTITGSATRCELGLISQTATRFTVTTSGCSLGTVQVSILENSYTDELGNVGPTVATASSLVTIVEQPVAAPPAETPAAAPINTAPQPMRSETPSTQGSSPAVPITPGNSDDDSGPGPVARIFSNYEIVPAQLPKKTYALTPSLPEQTESQIQGPQITVDNPTDDLPITSPSNVQTWFDLQMLVSGGVGIISIGFAGIGVYKAARQLRTRRLVKKFA